MSGTGFSARMAERRRLFVSTLIGGAIGATASPFLIWGLAALVAWDATVLVLIGWIWVAVGRMDAEQTRSHATREDETRGSTRVLLILASCASLVGVLFALVRASTATGTTKVIDTVVGVATVLCSWALVHTLYTLRYAHLFYSDHPGGIDFKDDGEPPAYADFAYVAFTVGMTFQVSDTDIQSAAIRRAVLRQALLSYLFGTVIVASAINVVAGLLK